MTIALFSDIHANLPAFEVMLKDMDCRKPDVVFCLGDLIGYHIWPNEVIEMIRQRGIATLTGNHDMKTTGYAYEMVLADHRKYLSTLPARIKLEYQFVSSRWNIVLAHGSTRSVNEYVLEDLDENYVLEMMNEANADILCIGHSHKPYHRIINCNGNLKHVINIGSVGKPKDGNTMGCWVLLTIDENIAVDGKDALGVDFIRFEYDVERATKAIEESPLPDELADRLRKAY